MTEKSFQEARKVMQKVNYLRGLITNCKGNVAKWSRIYEDKPTVKVKEVLLKAKDNLKLRQEQLLSMRFPDHNLPDVTNRCDNCGVKIKEKTEHVCEEFKS